MTAPRRMLPDHHHRLHKGDSNQGSGYLFEFSLERRRQSFLLM